MNDNTLIVGIQFGDEGKGKVVNYFMDYYDSCVRFNGGPNAGHTIYHNGEKLHLHQIPSGIVKDKPVYMEPGMVIDVDILEEEAKKYDNSLINISKFVHIIQDKHRKSDESGSKIGTTKRGIGYCYSDKALRSGIRAEDLPFDLPYNMYDVHSFNDKNYLFESAQGMMLDVDYGDYPYCTSSSVIPSMRYKINKVIGVMKAYVSRVGQGAPNTSSIEELQILGKEFGTTTGRLRRCFWFDFDSIKYVMKVLPVDEIVMTKCDILEEASEIAAYKNNELIKYANINQFIDDVRKEFPQLKYLSWSPENVLEKLDS